MSTEEQTGEPVLNSSYKPAGIPVGISNPSVCHFLLTKAEENARLGRLNWVTNTITGETIKYADIEPMSRNVANSLKLRGMKEGDVAIYLCTNVTQIFTVVLGVWRLGGIMHSSYPEDTKDTLLERIVESNVKWIFCDGVSASECLAASRESPWLVEVFVFGAFEGCTPASTLLESIPTNEESSTEKYSWEKDIVYTGINDPLLILCTSGTTGKCKGAVYTNTTMLGFCMTSQVLGWRPDPVLYIARCTHITGLFFPLRNIATGMWSLSMHQPAKENIFKAVEKYKPFLAFGFPAYLMTIAAAENLDKSCLEVMCTGGTVIKPIVYQELMKLPNVKLVVNGFGMTECIGITTTVDIAAAPTFRTIPSMPPYSTGRLYPNTSLKILDIETGKALEPNKSGEITFKSPLLCAGYWKRPEETAKTFPNGWMRTGDMGYYDENGFLFVSGRIKDNFKYYNNHISPEELEEIILDHEAVAEVCVFGIPDEGGDVPRAAIVLKPGFSVTPEEIQKFANDKVASYKNIRGGVYFVSSLPHGNTGKVLRSAVAAADRSN